LYFGLAAALRYVHYHINAEKWMHWDGACWKMDMIGEIHRLAHIFLRTLRQLRDLRRYSVTINAEQVNIGQQQVNTTGNVTGNHPQRESAIGLEEE